MAELIELGELDDERFAFAFAEDKRELAGWGAERIEAALLDRGLDRALAERACAERASASSSAPPRSFAAGARTSAMIASAPGRSRS